VNSPNNDNLGVRLGAAVLALTTLAAIVFGIINFQQRAIFSTPDDGVSWRDTLSGVIAWNIAPNSPAANAGIRTDDKVIAINNFPIRNSIEVTKRLWHIGLWSQAHYRIERGGKIGRASCRERV
jgi:S1-C subfamily serine protease